MASRRFPDSGSRYATRPNGDQAKNGVIRYFRDPAGQNLAPVYAERGTDNPAPGDALVGSQTHLDAFGGQVDFRGPNDDTDELYASIDGGPIFRVPAAPEPRLRALETAVPASQSAAIAAAATDATTKANAAVAAAAADASTKANARADRTLSNLAVASTARANLRIGAEQPTAAYGVTVTLVGTDPKPVDYFGGYLYGTVGTTLKRSVDDGTTWTTVATTPYEAQRLLPTADGELIMTVDNRLYKTSGWAANPATATWNLKLTANGTCSFFRFGIDGNGTKFIANEYSSVNRADSRYVYISLDAGTTWNTVWDTNAQFPATAAESHLHGCCYDPWEDRFWFSEGHGATGVPGVDNPRGTYYSNNNGASWTRLSGGYADTLAAMPTVLVATDDGIVCGTDEDPNGIMCIRRAPAAQLAYGVSWRRWEPKAGPYGFAERGMRDPNTGLVYFGYRAEYAATQPYIAAGTASSGGLVWDSALTGLGDKVQNVVITPTGRIFAVYINPTGTNILRGTIGLPGAPSGNTGNAGGATAALGTALASGLRASAVGASSTAVGVNSSATGSQGTAVGTAAQAGGNGTALGQDAQSTAADRSVAVGTGTRATGTNSAVLGYAASATAASATAIGSSAVANSTNATAVGRSASAVGNGTAVGSNASASGSDQSTALGCTATAAGSLGTSVGYAAAAGGTNTTAVGTSASAPSTGGTAVGKSASASTNGTAVGLNANASGSDQSTALGATATSAGIRSTAVGYGASSGGSDTTVVGNGASAASTNGTAIGRSATATGSGMAVGKSATASGADLTTAVGTSATASVTRGTALGHTANAGHDNAVALGYNSASTAANQVQIGARHLEGVELGADPTAPAADGFRLYAKDNGAGKTGLYVRFATGAVVQIAVEP